MNQRIKKGLLFFGTGFLVLFLLSLWFEFGIKKAGQPGAYASQMRQDNQMDGYLPYNIASSKVVVKEKTAKQPVTFDQKYERIAAADAKTKEFNQDEKKLRELIKKYKALVQYEKKTGLEGRRFLDLAIGVYPDLFDSMVEEIKNIGSLSSLNISKNDKTNEYKDLNAKKESLIKTRASLLALKNRGGQIAEFISLENRILEIEEQIQKLGVRLGEYDEENEFCTIKFTLIEKGYEAGASMLYKIKTALEWAVKYYCLFLLMAFFASLTAVLMVKLWEKISGYIKTP